MSSTHSRNAFHSEVNLHEDGAFVTDTESEDLNVEDERLDDYIHQAQDDERAWNNLRQQAHEIYVTAKRRWRKVMGRPTRRRRRLTRRKPKGKGRGKSRSFLCRLCSSHFDALEAEDFGTFIASHRKGKGKRDSKKESYWSRRSNHEVS